MTIGGFKKETAQIILEVVSYLRESGFVIPRPGRGEQFVPPDAPIYIRNDSGVEIPAFGCVQVTGTVEVSGQNYITVDHPVDATGDAGGYLFNGVAPIEVGGYGIAHDGPVVRMLTDGSAVACGEMWQPVVNSFLVSPGGSMFSAIGADDIETDVMRAFTGSGGGGGNGVLGYCTFIEDYTLVAGDCPITVTPPRAGVFLVTEPPCSNMALGDEEIVIYDPLGCNLDHDEAGLVDARFVFGRGTIKNPFFDNDPGTEEDPNPCYSPNKFICEYTLITRCCVAADVGA